MVKPYRTSSHSATSGSSQNNRIMSIPWAKHAPSQLAIRLPCSYASLMTFGLMTPRKFFGDLLILEKRTKKCSQALLVIENPDWSDLAPSHLL